MNGLFAENLRKLREERGLSQKQLGIQMFVNHSTIARWENGTRLPDAAMILRLARCLGVDVNTLLMMVELAVLDIEMGNSSGLELCRKLQEINPTTNVVFLTAYADYSLDAWKTEASGFILKPLTPDGIKEQLKKLRYPFLWGRLSENP